MCTRVTLRLPPEKMIELFELLNAPPYPLRYNIAPTQFIPIIRRSPAAQRECVMARWGLLPHWTASMEKLPGLFNARAESVDSKPSFRDAFRHRRCLIPVDGFYEWKTEGKKKLPFLFTCRDGQPLALGGLWEEATHGTYSVLSCTIITTNANALVAPIHDRMPAILTPKDFDPWLDPCTAADALKTMLAPLPPDLMEDKPVNPWLNNSRSEGPQCHEPPPVEKTLWSDV